MSGYGSVQATFYGVIIVLAGTEPSSAARERHEDHLSIGRQEWRAIVLISFVYCSDALLDTSVHKPRKQTNGRRATEHPNNRNNNNSGIIERVIR